MRLALVLVSALCAGIVSGCYRPGFQDCMLECGTAELCPDDLHCVAGFCRADRNAPACPQPDVDAGGGDADPASPDAAGPDAANRPDASCGCDPLTQSCCLAEDSCDLGGNGESYCRDVGAAAVLQAAPCSDPTQCARGYSCVDMAGAPGSGATCHELCSADTECPGQGGLCDQRLGATTFKVCTAKCEPISSTGCKANWACSVLLGDGGARWHTDCRPAGLGKQDDDCSSDADCKRSFQCVESTLTCAKICSLTAGGDCQGQGQALTCTSLGHGGAVIAGNEFGVCR